MQKKLDLGDFYPTIVYLHAVPPDKTSAVTSTLVRGSPLIILIGRLYLSVLDSTLVKVGASRDAPGISNPKTAQEKIVYHIY